MAPSLSSQRLTRLSGVPLACACFAIATTALAGKLDDAERETKPKDESHSPGSRSSSSSSSSASSDEKSQLSDEENALLAQLTIAFFRYVVLSAFTIPFEELEGKKNYFETFARPPMKLECGMLCVDKTGASRRVQLTGGAEIGIDVAGIPFTTASLRFESPYRLGLSTKMTGFREATPTGVDYSLLGHSELTVMFARSTHTQFRAGGGARYFAGPSGNVAFGFDFLYGVEVQTESNISFEGEIHLGNIGEAFSPELRGVLGYWISPVEFYLGWDQNWIGSVPLGGPVFGIRATY